MVQDPRTPRTPERQVRCSERRLLCIMLLVFAHVRSDISVFFFARCCFAELQGPLGSALGLWRLHAHILLRAEPRLTRLGLREWKPQALPQERHCTSAYLLLVISIGLELKEGFFIYPQEPGLQILKPGSKPPTQGCPECAQGHALKGLAQVSPIPC